MSKNDSETIIELYTKDINEVQVLLQKCVDSMDDLDKRINNGEYTDPTFISNQILVHDSAAHFFLAKAAVLMLDENVKDLVRANVLKTPICTLIVWKQSVETRQNKLNDHLLDIFLDLDN